MNVLACIGSQAHTTGWPGIADNTQQRTQAFLDLVGTHPGDQREPAGDAGRVQLLAQLEDEVGRRAWPDLAADGVTDAAEELDVGTVELACALADPQHVCRAVVPAAAQRILAGQRFLVAQQQRFVAGVEVDLVQVVGVLGVDTAGPHEAQGAIDLGSDLVVGTTLGARGDELLCPGVDPAEVGKPALGECPQQVQRRRGLVVGLYEPIRRRNS